MKVLRFANMEIDKNFESVSIELKKGWEKIEKKYLFSRISYFGTRNGFNLVPIS